MQKTPNQAQLSTPRRAHWPCRGPWPGRVVARAGRVAGSKLPCRSPRSRSPYALPRAMPRVYALPCRIVALAAVSWALAARQPGRIIGPVPRASWPCPGLSRDTVQPHALSLSHDTLQCIATHLLQQPNCRLAYLSVTIQSVYCDTNFSPALAASVTIQFVY